MPIFQYVDIQLFVIIIIAGVVTKSNTIRSDMNRYYSGTTVTITRLYLVNVGALIGNF
jgi:hypothetical protein